MSFLKIFSLEIRKRLRLHEYLIMEEAQLQKIEDYLLGKLKNKELNDFQQRQADDPVFAKAVQREEALFKGLQVYGNRVLKNRIGHVRTQMLEEEEPKYVQLATRRRYLYAVAAAILLLIGLAYWQWYATIDNEQVFANHFSPVYDLPISSRSDEVVNKQITEINRLYTQNNFVELIPKLELFQAQHPDEQYARLMLIIAYIGENRLAEAKASLRSFEASSELHDVKKWYEALVCVREGNIRQAKGILNGLQSKPSSDLHQRAVELLEVID